MTENRLTLEPEAVLETAARFRLGGAPTAAHELRSGHINDSYVVSSRGGRRGLLQRINEHVFTEPRRLMDNVERITGHLAEKLGPRSRRRRVTLIPADDGRTWVKIQSASEGSGRGKSASEGSGRRKSASEAAEEEALPKEAAPEAVGGCTN